MITYIEGIYKDAPRTNKFNEVTESKVNTLKPTACLYISNEQLDI